MRAFLLAERCVDMLNSLSYHNKCLCLSWCDVDTQIYAALTGDLIRSTRMPSDQFRATLETIARTVEEFGTVHPDVVLAAPDFFRGDSWQLVLAEPKWALRLALLIRSTLLARIGTDTRISIGVGGVDDLDLKRVSLSTGRAFVMSGRALDMTLYYDLSGGLPDRSGVAARWFSLVLHLCSDLVRGWTRRQAEIFRVGLILDDPKHDAIAKALDPPVSKQAVTQALKGANWHVLMEAVDFFEDTDWTSLVPAIIENKHNSLS